jgi:ABC-type lipoprotein release transport system permease subunit
MLRLMSSALYGVAVDDGPTLLSVVLVLALVTFVASTVPVLRIARIDPAQTLRDE